MPKNLPRARRGSIWFRRIVLVFLGVTIVIPVALILIARFVPPVLTPLMIATWVTEGGITREWKPLTEISPNLVRAVIASEDGKFCSHYG